MTEPLSTKVPDVSIKCVKHKDFCHQLCEKDVVDAVNELRSYKPYTPYKIPAKCFSCTKLSDALFQYTIQHDTCKESRSYCFECVLVRVFGKEFTEEKK